MLATTLAWLALLGGALMVWQWRAAARFPLDTRTPTPPSPTPPSVSLLKPVKGADEGTAQALDTWLTQRYPGHLEALFGVECTQDPGVPVIRNLLAARPSTQARLVECPERIGLNRKVSNLAQMARAAGGEILILSDADVAAPPDLVEQLTLPFSDPTVGLVHCLYRFADAPNLATRLEAFAVNADFWSQVLQNQTLKPLDYALGAVIAVRRSDLDAIGGFTEIVDHLADDNRLGRLIVGLGKRTHLCPVVVDCRVAASDWLSVWRHQLRWAVTIRVCQGLPYFLSILANGTFWALLWLVLSRTTVAITLGLALIAFRIVQGLALEARFTQRPLAWSKAWMVPLKDLLQVVLWGSAFLRRHVVWRGIRFRVLRDGRLEPA